MNYGGRHTCTRLHVLISWKHFRGWRFLCFDLCRLLTKNGEAICLFALWGIETHLNKEVVCTNLNLKYQFRVQLSYWKLIFGHWRSTGHVLVAALCMVQLLRFDTIDVWIVIKPCLVQQGRRVRVRACSFFKSNPTPFFSCTLAPPTVQSLEHHTQFWYSTNVIDGFPFHTSGSDSLDSCTRTCTCMHPAGVNPSGHTWDSPLAVKIYGYNIFSIFCALTACFALCASCCENLQACPWMHRLIWIVFTQIQERQTEELGNANMMSFGKAYSTLARPNCSILYRCEPMRVMNNETRLKTFCGRYQKNVMSGEPIRTFFFSLHFSLSPHVGAHSHEKLMRGRLRVRPSTVPALLQRPSSCSVCSAGRVINYFCCRYGGHLAEQRSVLFLCLSMCG